MDFSNVLDDSELGAKAAGKCSALLRRAVCVECGRPKDLLLLHADDLQPLTPCELEPCHGSAAVDWDQHLAQAVHQLQEAGSWTDLRSAVLARGGLLAQAAVLGLLADKAATEQATLSALLAANIELFAHLRNIAPNDASVLWIHEILTFSSEAFRRPDNHRLIHLAQRHSLKTREAHTVIWQLATQESYATGQYEDALRCLLYGLEPREGILPTDGQQPMMTIEELLVMSLYSPHTVSVGINLARVAQRLGKPAVAALHAYRCVVNRTRLSWQPPGEGPPSRKEVVSHQEL
eukprot:Protomagalhaensia_wolfi_Nauph_80__2587@NODE_2735_length_1002_cov_16_183801_g2143_i0_p1_GENE_NODE_2735_length_1002_cov_16_183801_g2143_i0NODE_2735_length_1002_cov_16_183801_g2143_i0_p1_ORF_typecomplete_len292_score40_63_NODE_2735_length_1002_cov_16_183801_g2143_i087962